MVIFFILLPILFDYPLTGDAQRYPLPDSTSSRQTVADVNREPDGQLELERAAGTRFHTGQGDLPASYSNLHLHKNTSVLVL
jgi:hypothetical protein